MMNKTLNLIGLAMRARKVVLGQDMVLNTIRNSKDNIIFLANDAGDNFKKKITDKAKTYNILIVTKFSSDELSKAVGKENRKVILITDKGFINRFNDYLNT